MPEYGCLEAGVMTAGQPPKRFSVIDTVSKAAEKPRTPEPSGTIEPPAPGL